VQFAHLVEKRDAGCSAGSIEHSLVIPVYRNEENIPDLLEALAGLADRISSLEVVFVVDGSPDNSHAAILEGLRDATFRWQLLELSRNFGAFAAIRQGLALARGQYMAVMAADLQEPPAAIRQFFDELHGDRCDLVVGVRASRADPLAARLTSKIYWWLYRILVMREIPAGGVDVFACNRRFRDALLLLEEHNSFLIGQLFWLGFRRKEILYERRPRIIGKSAWKFRRRLRYMLDSVFAFSDMPISLLLWLGVIGVLASSIFSMILIVSWMLGWIDVRGYVPLMLAVMFFGSVLVLSQGIVGCYVWRVAENTKKRPLSVVLSHRTGDPAEKNGSLPVS
jgi:glycosyltransferase involved in cell wall biosynthesis